MEYRILCQRSDGKMSIICDKDATTEQEILNRNITFIPSDTVEYKVVPVSELSSLHLDAWHKSDINAFVLQDGEIVIDMDKAHIIHMGTIRKLRNKKLEELDIETLKGIDVQSEKQVLRDIPQTFDLTVASTPEELLQLIPEELK